MTIPDKYLQEQLEETFKVVDTCLKCIYAGEHHMHRALASQLRILLCDTYRKKDNSLLVAVYPKLEVSGLKSIDWSSHESGYFEIRQPEGGKNRISQMPFEITQYANRLAVADLQLSDSKLMPIAKWSDQIVTYSPTQLTINEIIRSVADKGGGAHVDATMSPALKQMRNVTPVGETYAQLFIIAVARFVHQLGQKLFDYKGCEVPKELREQAHQKFNLGIAAHEEWVAAHHEGA